jgi:hypothetical protein
MSMFVHPHVFWNIILLLHFDIFLQKYSHALK